MSGVMIARSLRLLSLLQARRFWSGHALAADLGVSERTLRRDIDRLREAGYRITAERGAGGGYSLEPGAALPPLLLDDDELVVLAVGLRSVTARGVGHSDLTALSALAKLEQLLPSRLRRRVSALQSHAFPDEGGSAPSAAPDLIAQLALACRDSERVRFRYTDANGAIESYFVEPHCLVSVEHGWYLVAWEIDGGTWEAFGVNRMDSYFATAARFPPHGLSQERAAEIAHVAAGRFARGHVGLLRIHAPLEELRAVAGPWARDATAETDSTTLWPISADQLQGLAFGIAWIPEEYEFEVLEPAELRSFIRSFGTRLLRATHDSQG
ncbi:putative DNA-binding transcriptional regulator YafY [Nocardiopsis mwathae]|uniref:Putative DNA-binding transcriptional regulator YafY n=1 Tax=Nocardiopsis mwathae TaxID=1472723 RepID=A0A7W9YF97_9ACTN|nr:WYL domain-containing protein [Nocardiopsis mwathae]MBB6170186.1 putative DNA-binding transcriptional regulator YafY [Nocardiopsis mwathae]